MTNTIYRYRIYCITQGKWEYVWSDTPPTTCPVNPAHSINIDSISNTYENVYENTTILTNTFVSKPQNCYFCDTTNNDITITLLPTARLYNYFFFRKTNALNSLIIKGNVGTETIDGQISITLTNLNESVMIASPDSLVWITNPDPNLIISRPSFFSDNHGYTVTVDSSGNGDYKSIANAFNAGSKSVFVKKGIYVETSNIILSDGSQLIGEVHGGTYIVFAGPYSIKIDGSGGVKETTGTISITNYTKIITGSGTTFTNLVAGNFILIGTNYYEITSIQSDTQLTLKETYVGRSITNSTFTAQAMYTGCSVQNVIVASSAGPGLYIRGLRHGSVNAVAILKSTPCINIIDSADLSINKIITAFSVGSAMNISKCVSLSMHTVNLFNSSSHGFEIDGSNLILESCASENNNGSGFYLLPGTTLVNISDSISKYNNSYGINLSSSTLNMISNTEISNNNNNGLDMQCDNNTVTSCIIFNNGAGIVAGLENVINGNTIINNDGNGISVPSGSNSCVITNNSLKGNNGVGINILSSKTSASNNNIKTSSGDGIYVAGVKNKVADNIIIGSGAKGIQISASCSYCSITGNIVDTSVGSGLELITGAVNNIVTSNILEGNTGTNYINNGTNTISVNNIVT